MNKRLLILLVWLTPAVGFSDPSCPQGNLLRGKKPVEMKDTRLITRLTNNTASSEGSPWNGVQSAIMANGQSQVTYDLGQSTQISALSIQADNNDTYVVSASVDGKTYAPVWTVPKHPHSGLRTRLTQGLSQTARYLRFEPGAEGDGSYSISEIQAYCVLPAVWPPAVIMPLPTAKTNKASRKQRIAFKKLAVISVGFILLLMLLLNRRSPNHQGFFYGVIGGSLALASLITFCVYHEPVLTSGRPKTLVLGLLVVTVLWAIARVFKRVTGAPNSVWFARPALILILFAGGITWTNFGSFHGSKAIHYWDTFHYYMGGKYFSENRYELLYQCSAIGEVDDGRKSEFKTRQIRDLRDNKLFPASVALSRADECRAAFKSPERWNAFKQDLRLFRAYMGTDWWAKMFKDHGFNATPVWTLVGRPLTNIGWNQSIPPDDLVNSPANKTGKSAAAKSEIKRRFTRDKANFGKRIGWFTVIDGFLYIAGFLMIWWAFGLYGAAFAMLIWATGYPYAYFWTGGGFGRVPWWFMAVAGTCFLKRGYPLLGGAGITWSMLLRVFPGALIGGVSLKIGYTLLKFKKLTHDQVRLIAGCTIALVSLVALSVPAVDGLGTYKEFLTNSFKHKGTPLTNHMGLPTILSYDSDLIGRRTKDEKWAVVTLKDSRKEIEGQLLTKDVNGPIVKLRTSDGTVVEYKSAAVLSVEQDPFKKWKRGRQDTLQSRKVLHYALIFLFLAMIGYAGRRLDNWELTALSTLLITCIFELTCYYYSYLVLFALLAMRRMIYMVAAVTMVILGQVIQLNVGWYDEQYFWETVAVFGVQFFVLLGLCLEAFLTDKGIKLAPPLTAGLDSVSPAVGTPPWLMPDAASGSEDSTPAEPQPAS
ncbi:MAG: hypothetical protein CMH52_12145 [Myxococcales bacterium]|nr:hypothetical protein [Myxococcales bacterium]